jgi:hypothetical protein
MCVDRIVCRRFWVQMTVELGSKPKVRRIGIGESHIHPSIVSGAMRHQNLSIKNIASDKTYIAAITDITM